MPRRKYDFEVPVLGEARVKSPIQMSKTYGDKIVNYVREDEYILYDVEVDKGEELPEADSSFCLEKAGPREKIYFHPGHVHAGIVTCGGLCPGLNNVIRSIVRTLWYQYGVRRITGIRNGYRGFLPQYDLPIMELNPEVVDDIHYMGGSMLGSSRGGGDISEIVDAIERLNLNMLFTIGGDGTTKGALAIADEVERRNLKVSIIGIPKTIDNDLSFIQRSFGFETAVSKAVESVYGAHIEAKDAINGIGIVKLMGRESGFIAAHTALAMSVVNFVLIPEIPFDLEGEKGLMNQLKKRLAEKHRAVIIVAEGAGQELLDEINETDLSGNKKLANIGLFLKDKIGDYFQEEGIEVNIKYIDPSYLIRSTSADPNDSIYCLRLGAQAVHAAMAGKTRALISMMNDRFVLVPMKMAVSKRNFVDPEGSLWRDVLQATRMPLTMKN
ncbi:MAG: ATP-dependent 6-phosphofructokinase [Spirochaetales bacterium]|uniref:ATP-dependent 6-phosphofructokinase n=1 Tax=Candidatus Thalassospirochaeta sargassi TaxID=3119039 RepID=A0AAJ1I9Y3_9SPIO|nr:ATP-dependent 6-phosphofructokinase [Spirochaetales bacterium]